MTDIISPKTPEEKKKELEEYMKRKANDTEIAILQNARKQRELAKMRKNEIALDAERPIPKQYKWLEDLPWFKPEDNIGQKWADSIEA
jgi:hypothetical protein